MVLVIPPRSQSQKRELADYAAFDQMRFQGHSRHSPGRRLPIKSDLTHRSILQYSLVLDDVEQCTAAVRPRCVTGPHQIASKLHCSGKTRAQIAWLTLLGTPKCGVPQEGRWIAYTRK